MALTGAQADLREAIISASLELGSEHGEEGLTMRAIAGKLGVSPTALYQHFDGKTAILQEIRLRGMMQLGNSIVAGLAAGDARESLHAGSRAFVGFARDNPWLYRVLFHSQDIPLHTFTQEQREFVIERLGGVRKGVGALLGGGGGAVERSVSLFIGHWWCGLHGISSLLIGGRLRSDEPIVPIADLDGFVDDYLRSLVDSLLRRIDNRIEE